MDKERLLGGNPVSVAIRLVVLSVVVGIVLSALAIMVAVSTGDFRRYLFSGAKARVEQIHAAQRLKRRGVICKMLGLPPCRRLPLQTQPGEIVTDGLLEFRAASCLVDVFDP